VRERRHQSKTGTIVYYRVLMKREIVVNNDGAGSGSRHRTSSSRVVGHSVSIISVFPEILLGSYQY